MVALNWTMQQHLRRRARARCSGRPPTSAGWSAIPTSSTRRCCTAAPRSSTRASRSARPTPAPSGASIAEHRRRRAVHRADRLPRDQEGGSRRRAASQSYDLSHFRTLFLAGERADPDTLQWAERHARRAGHRPLVADRDRLGDRRQPRRARRCCRSSTARRRVPMPGYDVQVLDEGGKPVPAGHDGHASPSSCRCRRAACRRCGTPTSASATAYLDRLPGLLQDRRTPAIIDEDGYVYVMGRTDDIINVAGHRLSTGGMEEVLASPPGRRRMRRDRRRRRAEGRGAAAASSCSRPASTAPPDEIEARAASALVRERDRPGRRLQDWRSRSSACPRRAPARSCAAPCRRSPTATTWSMPATIDDPAILDEIAAALKGKGVGAAA